MSNGFIESRYTIAELKSMGYTVTPPATKEQMLAFLDDLVAYWMDDDEVDMADSQSAAVTAIRTLIEKHA